MEHEDYPVDFEQFITKFAIEQIPPLPFSSIRLIQHVHYQPDE